MAYPKTVAMTDGTIGRVVPYRREPIEAQCDEQEQPMHQLRRRPGKIAYWKTQGHFLERVEAQVLQSSRWLPPLLSGSSFFHDYYHSK